MSNSLNSYRIEVWTKETIDRCPRHQKAIQYLPPNFRAIVECTFEKLKIIRASWLNEYPDSVAVITLLRDGKP